jgi:hypothetical protein
MKAVIETKQDLFLIRLYGSDGLPCDTYFVDQLEFRKDKGGTTTIPANHQDIELALWILN